MSALDAFGVEWGLALDDLAWRIYGGFQRGRLSFGVTVGWAWEGVN